MLFVAQCGTFSGCIAAYLKIPCFLIQIGRDAHFASPGSTVHSAFQKDQVVLLLLDAFVLVNPEYLC